MTERDLHDLTEAEIQQSARLLIVEYGAEAEALAEMRLNEMQATKNTVGVSAWAKIFQAIQEFQATESKLS